MNYSIIPLNKVFFENATLEYTFTVQLFSPLVSCTTSQKPYIKEIREYINNNWLIYWHVWRRHTNIKLLAVHSQMYFKCYYQDDTRPKKMVTKQRINYTSDLPKTQSPHGLQSQLSYHSLKNFTSIRHYLLRSMQEDCCTFFCPQTKAHQKFISRCRMWVSIFTIGGQRLKTVYGESKILFPTISSSHFTNSHLLN